MHLVGTAKAVLEIELGAHRHTGSVQALVAVVGEEMWEGILYTEMEGHYNWYMGGRHV